MSEFGEFKQVKTRKPHQCVYCNRKIPKGSMARNFNGIWEGDWQNWYTCGFCEKYVESEYANPEECISGDEFWEWLGDSENVNCDKCKGVTGRFHTKRKWVDDTHIRFYCSECGNEWTIEIPFEGD